MKLRVGLMFLVLFSTDAFAAPPDFDGVMASGGINYFALRQEPSVAIKWIKLGDFAGDYLLKSYDREKQTLSLTHNGESVDVLLKTSLVRSGPNFARSGPTIAFLASLTAKGDVSHQAILDMLSTIRDRRDETAGKLAAVEAKAAKFPEQQRTEMVKEWRRKLELEEENLEYYTDQAIAHWREESRSSK